MQGHCLCRAVCITIHRPAPVLASGLEVCHCTDCRRLTGALGGTFLTVDEPGFEITRGADELDSFQGRSEAGNKLMSFWCRVCGGKVYQTSEGFPGEMSVHAGESLSLPSPAATQT